MSTNIKIKNSIKYLFSIFFIIGFLLNTNTILAASISFSSGSSYRVGDIISAKIIVNSDIPINAVSAHISYPVDKLAISSISKSGSIISLWAKEPSFSNVNGTAILEGIILNGYSGNYGNIVTVNFRTKQEGQAPLDFIKVSILANDGNGTEIPATKISSTITILKALPVPIKVVEEKSKEELPLKEAIIEKAKDAVTQIREVEKTSKLPDYSLVITLLLVIIILLILIIIYGIYYIKKLWLVFKKKISKASNNVLDDLEVLRKDLNNEIIIADKVIKNETLEPKDISFQIKLEKDINNAEGKIVKEIKELEVEK
jgi:hypothetical protein